MSTGTERIHDVSGKVSDLQDSLAMLQVGLETAEAVASGIEQVGRRSRTILKVVIVVAVVSAVSVIVVRRRRGNENADSLS